MVKPNKFVSDNTKITHNVYYRLNEIAVKFGISQDAILDILEKIGISPVLPDIYDRESFKGKVRTIKKLVKEYNRRRPKKEIATDNPDGYMNVNEIAEIFGTDPSCIKRKLNKMKLPYIDGPHNSKRYHVTIVDKYAHILMRGSKVPLHDDVKLREKGYIPFLEFEALAGISRVTLLKRLKNGLYSDVTVFKSTNYINRRNLYIQQSTTNRIMENTPSGYIPLVTIREILGLDTLSIQQYVNIGIVNPLYVVKKCGFVYLKREEAEKFIEWYKKK